MDIVKDYSGWDFAVFNNAYSQHIKTIGHFHKRQRSLILSFGLNFLLVSFFSIIVMTDNIFHFSGLVSPLEIYSII